jgi:hypothetical protein
MSAAHLAHQVTSEPFKRQLRPKEKMGAARRALTAKM